MTLLVLKNEFEFHAIEADKAYALRELIMAEKQNIVSKTKESNTLIEAASDATGPYQMIMSISPKQLLKVGLTENHIKSGGLILLFFFWIYQNLQEVGVDVDEYSDEIPEWEVGFYVVLALVTFSL